jgi:hypothetical protein
MTTIDPSQIKDDHARHSLELALDYKRQIDELVSLQPELIRQRLSSTLANVERMLAAIEDLVQALDRMENNTTLSDGKIKLPHEIDQLKQQEKRERNVQKKIKLNEAIATKEALLRQLGLIEAGVEETRVRLDETVNHLKEILQKVERLPPFPNLV